jgi:hypothetical protein
MGGEGADWSSDVRLVTERCMGSDQSLYTYMHKTCTYTCTYFNTIVLGSQYINKCKAQITRIARLDSRSSQWNIVS